MATQWMRWNPTTHIFEYSTDGTTFGPMPLNASVLTEGTLNPAVIPGGGGGGVPAGSIMAFGGAAAPTGYLLCNGAAVSRTTYATLFAAISTTYGAGDGSTTFNLPDLQQRFPLGKSVSGTGAALGSAGGLIDHSHTFSQNAPISGTGSGATGATGALTTSGPNATIGGFQTGSGKFPPDPAHTHTLAIPALGVSVSSLSGTAAVSGSTSVINPPFLTVNYIIKT